MAIIGTASGETLTGTAAADTINGLDGDDTLRGLAGNDLLSGGLGDDILDGGAGEDTATYAGMAGGVTVDLIITGLQAAGAAGRDTLIGIENLTGSAYGDLLLGDANANKIDGQDGDDELYGRAGGDILTGGAGADHLYGGAGADTLSGGAGADTLTGDVDNDILNGDAGDDVLQGGEGNDVLDGGSGNDSLLGGVGDDTLVWGEGVDVYDGGDGVDSLTFAALNGRMVLDLSVPGSQTFGASISTYIGIENVVGTAFNDVITGDGAANKLDGGLGNDLLFGGAGADTMDGGAGDDTLAGGLGDDKLEGGDGADVVDYSAALAAVKVSLSLTTAQATGEGSDTLLHFETVWGSAFADELTGNASANVLDGNAGDDILQGGGGDDSLFGDDGVDTAKYAGLARNYALQASATGWTVRDLLTTDGVDTLYNVERVQFSDKTIVIDVGLPQDLRVAFAAVLREQTWSDATVTYARDVSARVAGGQLSHAAALVEIIAKADSTTSVASMSYQFFTGKTPSSAGVDYLVARDGANPNNLNSAYFQAFNLENRYINFAVNLGRDGEGKTAFAATYAGLSLFDSTREAYKTIFGATPTDAKIHALIDDRTDYFMAYGNDRDAKGELTAGVGTKAAMVGWLLAEAEKADLGLMARSNAAWLADLAHDGTAYAVNIVGLYGKPDYVFGG